MLYVYLCTCTIRTCINKMLYGCKIPVSYIYICMYTKNIDPSVSHTVNLCKIFNFDVWMFSLLKVCGAVILRILFHIIR